MVNDISLAHISYRSVEQNKTPDIFWITLLYRSNHSCKSKCSQTATDLGGPDFKPSRKHFGSGEIVEYFVSETQTQGYVKTELQNKNHNVGNACY